MRNALLAWGFVLASPCIAIAQVAILHIRVTEGEGAVHRAGSRAAHPLTVAVTDETGRPQAGAAVSFHLPEDGPSGVFGNGLRTDLVVTDEEGRASVRSLQLNHVPGPFRIRITVAKEHARAGIVSLQYITDAKGTGATTARGSGGRSVPAKSVERHSHRWLLVALVVAGAAAGGIGAGMAVGNSGSSSAAAPPQVSVGVPTISLGKP